MSSAEPDVEEFFKEKKRVVPIDDGVVLCSDKTHLIQMKMHISLKKGAMMLEHHSNYYPPDPDEDAHLSQERGNDVRASL